jgi:hypothetical protein
MLSYRSGGDDINRTLITFIDVTSPARAEQQALGGGRETPPSSFIPRICRLH